MHVGILGPLEVVVDGTPVEIRGSRVRALLIRLALDPGRPVTVTALASALWPGEGPAQPVNAVQTLVSRLRRALPAGDLLSSTPGGYRLDVPPEQVDAVRFEALVLRGRHTAARGDARTAGRQLREALALWRGEALADVADAPFAAAAAARLAEVRLAAVEERVAADLDTEPPPNLVAEIRELVRAYPLREPLRALLIRALHHEGRDAEALAEYDHARNLIAERLGADPGPALREAHLAVLRAPAGPRRTARRPRGNLRAALTSFIGRTAEQERIIEQLAQRRLVTLTGPGGAGKTRLATTVAATLAEHLPGGAWLVELAPVSEPADIPQAVIDALGLRDVALPEAPGPRGPLDRVVDAMSTSESLLVLDNCEHVLDAAAALVGELLGRCRPLRVLATSREPLGILGEALWPVPPLGLPHPDPGVAEAAASPAVRLFTDRAAAAYPAFALAADNAATVVEICRRLDGLPLAIELAAARLRSLTLDQVAARLGDRFRLLAVGNRGGDRRHRTLRAVVAWSWDLLDPQERRVAEQLAVFPDAITPAAAARVCHPAPNIQDLLATLVDKSLLQLHGGAEPRYRMLETIREYGLARLAETGDLGRVRARYTAWYLELAERAGPRLRSGDQLVWMDRLHAAAGAGTALGFARAAGDAETLVRLAAALSSFWTIQGHHAVAARRLRRVLDVIDEVPAEVGAAVVAAYLVNLLLAGGEADEGVPAAWHHRTWPADQPAAAMAEAALALIRHDTAAGLAATARHLSDPDPWRRGMLWLLRSWLHGNAGRPEDLHGDLDAAVAAFREAGDRWGLATSLTHRAHLQITFGEFADAVAALAEAIGLLRELDPGDPAVAQRVLLAAARSQQGDHARARAELRELVAPEAGPSSGRQLVLARISLGDLARLDGDPAQAALEYDAAAQELATAPFDASLFHAMLQCGRGHLAVANGDFGTARWQLAEAFAGAVETPDMPIAADVAVAVARLVRASAAPGDEGPADTAARVLGAAHALRGSPDAFDPDVTAQVRHLRAALGEEVFQAAYERGRGLEHTDAVALIKRQLARAGCSD